MHNKLLHTEKYSLRSHFPSEQGVMTQSLKESFVLNKIIEELEAMNDLFVPDETLSQWRADVSQSNQKNKQEIISLLDQARVQLPKGKQYGPGGFENQLLGVVFLKEKLESLKSQS